MRFVDLFAGCGGLSEGFIRAGFHPVAHVEMNRNACDTLVTRGAYYYFKNIGKLTHYYSYLKKEISREQFLEHVPNNIIDSVVCNTISHESLNDIFLQIDKNIEQQQIDIIIGGPPCQAYSVIARGRKGIDILQDERNSLYTHYEEFIKRYNPKYVVLENVPGLLSAGNYLNDMIDLFLKLGYHPKRYDLNAKNFGVLQNRRRIVIIASKDNEPRLDIPNIDNLGIWSLKNSIFHDLPALKPGESKDIAYYINKPSKYQNTFRMRCEDGFTTQHIARKHNDRDLTIYKIAIEKWLFGNIRLRYNDLPEHLITHKNKNSFLDRFKVVNHEGLSHTMVAHIAKDGHYYIYPSLEQIRSLSVREAARIQSFPDDYYFEGSRSAVFTQIGNAVPPLLAECVAKTISDNLL